MHLDDFRTHIRGALSRETSVDPQNWTPDNPFWGHCVVVTLLAQHYFGGEILRASLEGTPFASMRSHYWNRLPTGEEDFSKEQFQENPPILKGEIRTREYLLSNPETRKRYQQFKKLFETIETK